MSLSRYEQETISNYSEAEPEATINTYDSDWIKKLRELSIKRSEECKFIKEQQGIYSFSVPASWIKIRPGRILTKEKKGE